MKGSEGGWGGGSRSWIRASRTGLELAGSFRDVGAFGGKNIYAGTSALSLLLVGSEGTVLTAAGPHLGLACFCFLHLKTPGKGLSGGGGTRKRSEQSGC